MPKRDKGKVAAAEAKQKRNSLAATAVHSTIRLAAYIGVQKSSLQVVLDDAFVEGMKMKGTEEDPSGDFDLDVPDSEGRGEEDDDDDAVCIYDDEGSDEDDSDEEEDSGEDEEPEKAAKPAKKHPVARIKVAGSSAKLVGRLKEGKPVKKAAGKRKGRNDGTQAAAPPSKKNRTQ